MEEDGGAVGVLLPAFYQTLDGLRRSGRQFSIVLRTFGTDLPRVAAAINAYAAGEHPDYPEGAPDLALPPQRMWKGRYDEGSGRFALSPHDEGNGAPSITDEREAVAALSEHGVSGVMDDYKYWASHDNDPACGKPLWLTLGDASTYQLFFDDNIQCAAAAPPDAQLCRARRDDASPSACVAPTRDSIVSVRARRDDLARVRAALGAQTAPPAPPSAACRRSSPCSTTAGSSQRSRGARRGSLSCAARHCGLSCAPRAAATLRPTSRRRRGRQSSLR